MRDIIDNAKKSETTPALSPTNPSYLDQYLAMAADPFAPFLQFGKTLPNRPPAGNSGKCQPLVVDDNNTIMSEKLDATSKVINKGTVISSSLKKGNDTVSTASMMLVDVAGVAVGSGTEPGEDAVSSGQETALEESDNQQLLVRVHESILEAKAHGHNVASVTLSYSDSCLPTTAEQAADDWALFRGRVQYYLSTRQKDSRPNRQRLADWRPEGWRVVSEEHDDGECRLHQYGVILNWPGLGEDTLEELWGMGTVKGKILKPEPINAKRVAAYFCRHKPIPGHRKLKMTPQKKSQTKTEPEPELLDLTVPSHEPISATLTPTVTEVEPKPELIDLSDHAIEAIGVELGHAAPETASETAPESTPGIQVGISLAPEGESLLTEEDLLAGYEPPAPVPALGPFVMPAPMTESEIMARLDAYNPHAVPFEKVPTDLWDLWPDAPVTEAMPVASPEPAMEELPCDLLTEDVPPSNILAEGEPHLSLLDAATVVPEESPYGLLTGTEPPASDHVTATTVGVAMPEPCMGMEPMTGVRNEATAVNAMDEATRIAELVLAIDVLPETDDDATNASVDVPDEKPDNLLHDDCGLASVTAMPIPATETALGATIDGLTGSCAGGTSTTAFKSSSITEENTFRRQSVHDSAVRIEQVPRGCCPVDLHADNQPVAANHLLTESTTGVEQGVSQLELTKSTKQQDELTESTMRVRQNAKKHELTQSVSARSKSHQACSHCGVISKLINGLCRGCYMRQRRYGRLHRVNDVNIGRTCSTPGCGRSATEKGKCSKCAQRERYRMYKRGVILGTISGELDCDLLI